MKILVGFQSPGIFPFFLLSSSIKVRNFSWWFNRPRLAIKIWHQNSFLKNSVSPFNRGAIFQDYHALLTQGCQLEFLTILICTIELKPVEQYLHVKYLGYFIWSFILYLAVFVLGMCLSNAWSKSDHGIHELSVHHQFRSIFIFETIHHSRWPHTNIKKPKKLSLELWAFPLFFRIYWLQTLKRFHLEISESSRIWHSYPNFHPPERDRFTVL